MSSRCKCPFSVHTDTILGSHRDPISSEKCWLDFAVRELSRVAAGKARGQEAVWRSQCKPAWWDCACPHPWKNPTANPKDSKDTLKTKFECLVQHLRKEGQIPADMREEIDKWENGQVQELFLMTSFSCILGQASNLHSNLDDACRKMEETGISDYHTVLTDLQSCLSACVQKISTMKNTISKAEKSGASCSDAKRASSSGRKRLHDKSDSDEHSLPYKHSKLISSAASPCLSSPALPPSSSPSPSDFPVSVKSVSHSPLNPEQQKAALHKLLLERVSKGKPAVLPAVQNLASVTKSRHTKMPVKQPAQKRQAPSTGSLAVVTAAPLASLPVPVSKLPTPETTDAVDFLDLDLVNDDDTCGIDLDFWDDCLEVEEKTQDESAHSNIMENIGRGSVFLFQTEGQNSPVQNHTKILPSPDPLLCPTSVTARIPQNIPAPVQMPLEPGADRLDCLAANTIVEDLGIALSPDARDNGLGVTETVNDSGYDTSSPISHRSSFDADPYSNADLSSPELEALLDAFP